jgi:hypothetical protein
MVRLPLRSRRGPRPEAAGAGARRREEPLSNPDHAALSPQAWCRRILSSLLQRKVEGPEAGDLEMLLTYFIELDPSTAVFTDLLARYASDSRAGIADAAGLLQRSWLRGRSSAAREPMPLLAEALRAVGGGLDEALARAAYIVTEHDSIQVQTFGDLAQVTLGPQELNQEIAARTALRGQVAPTDPTGTERYETRLRAVGSVLDDEPPQSFAIVVTRRTVVVEGSEGSYNVFTNDDLAVLLRAIVGRRQETSE